MWIIEASAILSAMVKNSLNFLSFLPFCLPMLLWVSRGRLLWGVVLCAQTLLSVLVTFGILMEPIGCHWFLAVWIYALAWGKYRIKSGRYRIFDPMGELFLRGKDSTDKVRFHSRGGM